MGIQQVLLATSALNGFINVASGTLGRYGYSVAASYGSYSGSINFSIATATAPVEVDSESGSYDFLVQANNTVYTGNQTGAFTSVTVYNQANNPVTYTAAAANYTNSTQTWSWGTGSSPVWTAGSITRQIYFS